MEPIPMYLYTQLILILYLKLSNSPGKNHALATIL